MYALWHIKEKCLLTVTTHRLEGEESVDVEHELRIGKADGYNAIWMTNSPTHADKVRREPEQWYNAGYSTPKHDFKRQELKVVAIDITSDDVKELN